MPFETKSLPDHIVVNNTWIYLSENYDAVIEAFSNLSIENFDEITIPQYLRLTQFNTSSNNIEIIDEIKPLLSAVKNADKKMENPQTKKPNENM